MRARSSRQMTKGSHPRVGVLGLEPVVEELLEQAVTVERMP